MADSVKAKQQFDDSFNQSSQSDFMKSWNAAIENMNQTNPNLKVFNEEIQKGWEYIQSGSKLVTDEAKDAVSEIQNQLKVRTEEERRARLQAQQDAQRKHIEQIEATKKLFSEIYQKQKRATDTAAAIVSPQSQSTNRMVCCSDENGHGSSERENADQKPKQKSVLEIVESAVEQVANFTNMLSGASDIIETLFGKNLTDVVLNFLKVSPTLRIGGALTILAGAGVYINKKMEDAEEARRQDLIHSGESTEKMEKNYKDSALQYKTTNDMAWQYEAIVKKMNDPSSLPDDPLKAEEITNVRKKMLLNLGTALQKAYPDLVNPEDIGSGKLDTKLLKNTAHADRSVAASSFNTDYSQKNLEKLGAEMLEQEAAIKTLREDRNKLPEISNQYKEFFARFQNINLGKYGDKDAAMQQLFDDVNNFQKDNNTVLDKYSLFEISNKGQLSSLQTLAELVDKKRSNQGKELTTKEAEFATASKSYKTIYDGYKTKLEIDMGQTFEEGGKKYSASSPADQKKYYDSVMKLMNFAPKTDLLPPELKTNVLRYLSMTNTQQDINEANRRVSRPKITPGIHGRDLNFKANHDPSYSESNRINSIKKDQPGLGDKLTSILKSRDFGSKNYNNQISWSPKIVVQNTDSDLATKLNEVLKNSRIDFEKNWKQFKERVSMAQ
ncbi:hypothetical protein F4V43_11285 [Paenibacillus spiritus]|uniref:Uncharacterized protein n=1 Tax=Paenibacillus spiritus TaxID=2496557 RepID=A0A5J5G8J4_9BACL|nr:hypothetical protein [Paenibacillus spiritus]KAA9003989.1 hypothetical protein F4V43_11285 [Paenibacillus spiritus]